MRQVFCESEAGPQYEATVTVVGPELAGIEQLLGIPFLIQVRGRPADAAQPWARPWLIVPTSDEAVVKRVARLHLDQEIARQSPSGLGRVDFGPYIPHT